MHYSTFLSVSIAALHFSSTAIGLSIPSTKALKTRAENDNIIPFPFDEADPGAIEDAFSTITAIPDSVLDQGDEALKAWITAHHELTIRTPPLEPRQSLFDIVKCAGAIIKAIAENAFPISKLRRLKELIGLLGGARKVAKLLLKAKTFREVLIIGGPELQEIAEILLGITDVVNECFSF